MAPGCTFLYPVSWVLIYVSCIIILSSWLLFLFVLWRFNVASLLRSLHSDCLPQPEWFQLLLVNLSVFQFVFASSSWFLMCLHSSIFSRVFLCLILSICLCPFLDLFAFGLITWFRVPPAFLPVSLPWIISCWTILAASSICIWVQTWIPSIPGMDMTHTRLIFLTSGASIWLIAFWICFNSTYFTYNDAKYYCKNGCSVYICGSIWKH